MSITGLGKNKQPFGYLDNFIGDVDWKQLHAEMSFGISQSQWNKKFVSSGIHKDWITEEITPYFLDIEGRLSQIEQLFFRECKTVDEKIKYLNALTPVAHPFWVIFIRNNKRIDVTGIVNKAVANDCYWTDNAKHFPTLLKLINRMPFKEVGRVMMFMTEANNQILPHYDGKFGIGKDERPNDDFIWFTTKPDTKQIFVLDGETKEKIYPDSSKKFIWFNEMDYHGSDMAKHFAFSIRIDGVFADGVKDTILV